MLATVAICSHVLLVTLNLELPNYNKWKAFFTAMCGKFNLLSHINSSVPAHPTDPTWAHPDSCVRSWIYTSSPMASSTSP